MTLNETTGFHEFTLECAGCGKKGFSVAVRKRVDILKLIDGLCPECEKTHTLGAEAWRQIA